MATPSRFFKDNSTENAHIQESCVKEASWAGAKAALAATALSGALIFGGCHFFPRFAKALSTSARTALIASPGFAMFFLETELTLNECAQRKRHLQMSARNAAAGAH